GEWWCARSSASICTRRRSTGTGSIASSTVTVHPPLPAHLSAMPRVVICPVLPDRASLDNEIARLRDPSGELRSRWHNVFGRRPHPHLPRHLLFRVLARADCITNISERRFPIRTLSARWSPPRARRGRSIILQNR